MKNDNFFIYVIPINIIAFAILLISIGNKTWNSGRQPQAINAITNNKTSMNEKNESIDKYVDRELYYAEIKKQLEKDKIESAKQSSIGAQSTENLQFEEKQFGFFVDKQQKNIEDKTRSEIKKKFEAFTVGYKVQAELADQKAFSEYSEEYKQAFVEEFINRAKDDGYEVEVSDDYVVTNVKTIRKPQSDVEKKTFTEKQKKIDLNQFAN